MAITLATDLQQATSAYKNISMEDFLDALDQVNPADTPMTTLAENEIDLGSTEFAKNVDSFDAPGGALGVADGEAAATGSATNHAANIRKIGNIAQGHREILGVGWIAARLPKVAGIPAGGLLTRAKTKAAIQLKRKQEVAFCSLDQTAVQDGGPSLGALGAGYFKLISSANKYSSATAFAYGKPSDLHYAPSGAVITGVMSAVHSRSMWKGIAYALRVAAQSSGDWTLLAGLTLRQAITDLTSPSSTTVTTSAQASAIGQSTSSDQVRVLLRNEADSVLGATVDVIQTDFGRITVQETDYIGKTTETATGALTGVLTVSANRIQVVFSGIPTAGLILRRGNVFKRWGIPVFSTPLAADGGGDKLDTKCLLAFGVRHPGMAGAIDTLT